MRKLTIVTATFPPEVNGVTTSLCSLIPRMGDRSIDVRVLAPDYTPVRELFPTLDAGAVAEHCRIVRYPSLNFGGYPFARKPRPFGLRVIPRDPAERVLVLEPDRLVWGNLRLATHGFRRTVGFLRQNYYQAASYYYSRALFAVTGSILRRFIAHVYNQHDALFALSDSARAELIRLGVTRPVVTVAQGINLDLFHGPAAADCRAPLRLAYVGRLAPEKNVGLLAQVFRPGRFSPEELQLDCYGNGPELKTLRAATDPRCVSFHGFVSQDRLPAVYQQSHFLLNPCGVETFGNAVLEAMACGCPVLALDGGANRDHVRDGDTGYRFADSATDLERLLRRLLGGCTDYSTLSENAVRHASRYQWDTATDIIEEQLFGVMKGGQTRGNAAK